MSEIKQVAEKKRRGTIVEEAAEGLLTEKVKEQEQKSQKKTFKEKLSSFTSDVYNSEKREFLHRDGKDCFQLSFFYSIFFFALSATFVGLLAVFYQTLDLNVPTYYNQDSVMNQKQVNPALGFRPQYNPEDALIYVNLTDQDRYEEEHIQSLIYFLDEYEQKKNETIEILPDRPDRVEKFDYHSLIDNTPCSVENKFGYSNGTPCVLLKMNRIFGWKPKALQFPPKNISHTPEVEKINAAELESEKFIYVTCEGENSYDIDNIGEIEYYSLYPSQEIGGIPTKFYPYKKQKNYLSPLVFAHFKSVAKNVLINVECKLWAQNIDNTDRFNQRGMIRFEIFIADNSEAKREISEEEKEDSEETDAEANHEE
jgi:sodium/potassium-transporting ATPase subunit beta